MRHGGAIRPNHDETGPLVVGIDVGGTKILGVVTDLAGTVVVAERAPTPRHPDAVPTAISAMATGLIERHQAVVAVGVGVPGLVDHRGVLHYGPNVPGVLGLDIATVLVEATGLPVAAGNDASWAVSAEHRLGAARGHDHAVIVTQGTGIGGGLIVNGEVLRGANGFAGEPGHMMIDRGGPRCACGSDGCWEAVASGAGLANLARRVVADGGGRRMVALAGGDPAHIRGEHVSQALAAGDADAARVIDEFVSWVALGLASLVNLLDPSIAVLGGGLTAISDHFVPDVQDQVAAMVLGAGHRPVVPVVPAALGPEAGAVGAALGAADLVTNRPATERR